MTDYLVIGQAEIDEMRQRIAADRWIPVGERLPELRKNSYLPEFSDRVLVLTRKRDVEICRFFRRLTGRTEWPIANVTHWRPLPEPPQEEEETP